MSQDDLLSANYKIMHSLTEQIVKHWPEMIIVPVVPAGCDVPGRLPAEQVPPRAGHRIILKEQEKDRVVLRVSAG
jgi:hypothetical protein